MRYTPNLNIIIKAIQKATNRVSRDFNELENLQNNPISAQKFSLACYKKVEQIIAEDIKNFRPEFAIEVFNGQQISNAFNDDSNLEEKEYKCIILPIDGIENLFRSNHNFTMAVALQHLGRDKKYQTISLAINNFANNNIHSLQCATLEIAYLASARTDAAFFSGKNNIFIANLFSLIIEEAGGRVIDPFQENEINNQGNKLENFNQLSSNKNGIILTNNLINFYENRS